MAVADLVRRWAADAPAPIFVARGGGADLVPVELAADPRLRLVPTPRHASVLVAAGRFPGPMGVALDRVHDQMGAPCRTVWWTADPEAERPAALRDAELVTGIDPTAAIGDAHRRAVAGGDRDEDVYPDVPPHLFEGRGDTGHGGEGMMGGVPWGRPMAMTASDRDGLALDQQEVTWGPFLVGLPTGVQVRTLLQGGLAQEVEVAMLGLGAGPALDEAGSVGARRPLQWLAEVLRLSGLDALGTRAARLARDARDARDQGTGPDGLDGSARARATLVRRVRRSGLAASWVGLAPLNGRDARQRLELALSAILAGEARPSPTADADLSPGDVGALLVGLSWTDAVAALASLDLRTDARRVDAPAAP